MQWNSWTAVTFARKHNAPTFLVKNPPYSCKTKYGTNAEQSNYLDVFVNTANGLCTVNLCSTWSAIVDFSPWTAFHCIIVKRLSFDLTAAIIIIFIRWLLKWKVKACANRCCLHGRLTPNGTLQQVYHSAMKYNERVEI